MPSTFELELEEESSGTHQLLALKARVDHVLKHGGVALIDELNAYLHPLMELRLRNGKKNWHNGGRAMLRRL